MRSKKIETEEEMKARHDRERELLEYQTQLRDSLATTDSLRKKIRELEGRKPRPAAAIRRERKPKSTPFVAPPAQE